MHKDFYIYGRNPITEKLIHDPKSLKRIYIKEGTLKNGFDEVRELAQKNHIPINSIDEKGIEKLLKDEVSHQGIIALSKPFAYTSFEEWVGELEGRNLPYHPTVLILDHIQDVSNLGAIIRSATAAGVDAIIVAELNQAPVTSAVYKTSAGTVGRIPLIQVGNINQTIERLKKASFWILGLAMAEEAGAAKKPGVKGTAKGSGKGKPQGKAQGGSTDLWRYTFDTPVAIIIGGEGDGIREKTAEHCDTLISIPMQNDVESLNASVSSALVCYEIMRQRNAK